MTIKECTKEDLLDIIKSKDAEIEQLKRDLGQFENLYKQQQYQLGEAKSNVKNIFVELHKILEKHHDECYEYEDGDECDTAITYISYISCDIYDLEDKYTKGESSENI